ncbi:MAG: LytTR family DNA-binding domain-containing protein [Bryobacterales bacterium]|nr:LytTR family DNA-binding domain-containing protein [Bryobacterales bacterium]
MTGGTNRLRTLTVDDEEAAREVLRRDLSELEGIEIVGEAENGDAARRQIKALDPDLVLLDIQMPVCDGFEVVRSIQGHLPSIVFVTAYSEHALKAFEVGAVDYLLKPFGVERLKRSIDRARQARRRPQDSAERMARTLNADAAHERRIPKIVACHGRDFLLLDLDQIYAFRAAGETVWIQTRNRQFRATQTLGSLSRRLSDSPFLRVHRSILVNSDKIKRISALSSRRWLLTLDNGIQCTVSKRNAAMVRALLA